MRAVLALLLLAACRDPVPEARKLVVITPLTGPSAEEGAGYERGARMALEDAQAEGALDREVRIVVYDDGADPGRAAEAARKVVEDPTAFAVIGPMNSGPAMAAARPLAYKGIAMITTAGSSEVTRIQETLDWPKKRVVFQLTPSSLRQGDWDAEYARLRMGITRVAVINDGGYYGRDLAAVFERGFRARGGEVLLSAEAGADPSEPVRAVLEKSPELVFFGGMSREAGAFMAAARAAGYKGHFMAGGGARRPPVFDVGGAAVEGAYFSMPGVQLEILPLGTEFANRYRARYGQEPRMMDHYAYDAVRIALWAIKKTKGEREAAPDAIRSQAHETMMGSVLFDGKGLPVKGLISMSRADTTRKVFEPVR